MRTGSGRFLACIATALVAAFAAVALAGCAQLTINTNTEIDKDQTPALAADTTLMDGVLTVGINGSNTPYGGTNEGSGKTVGLDVDIAAALADELGMGLQIVDVNSNGKASLSSAQVDLSLGVVKSGSDKSVAYTSAYINDGSSLFVLEENLKNVGAIVKKLKQGKQKVLVQAQTTTALEVQEELGIDSVIAQGTLREAFDALVAGDAKCLVADAVCGDYWAASYSNVRRVDFLSPDSVRPMYAITKADNVELTQAVDKAMETITNNGILRNVVDKWLGTQGEDLLPGKVDIASIDKLFGK
mgnify:FL=1